MKTFFEYCFYRISKFYLDWGESRLYCSSGLIVVASVIVFYCLSLLIFALYLFDKELSFRNLQMLMGISVVIILIALFVFDLKTKYKQLQRHYKNEKHSKLKGWLIFLFAISSVASYFITMVLCGYWVDAKM
jgi:Ca2+/Na+ antiporter